MPISWSLAYGCGQQQIHDNKTYMSNAGSFDHHVDGVVQCGVHRPLDATIG